MPTPLLLSDKTRFHNKPELFAVQECDTVPRSEKHAARMTESQKKRMARNLEQFKSKNAAIVAKEKADEAETQAIGERALARAHARADEITKAEADKAAAKAAGKLFQEKDSELVLVVRIKGINKVAPKPKKVLELLRLRQVNSAVFIRMNKSTMAMLTIINPWVTYGYPTVDMVRALIYKRGWLRFGKMGAYTRVRIQSNNDVDHVLGNHGIKGVEDLVSEICDVGPNFTAATRALVPFRLSSPTGGFEKKKRHAFTEMCGGESGNREKHINQLVKRMM